jgi:hypothetical protein
MAKNELVETKRGIDRGVVVKDSLPYAPENIRLSKEKFIAKEKARKEKDLKIQEYSKQLDAEKEEKLKELDKKEEEAVKVEASETPEKKKPGRRPKKIE